MSYGESWKLRIDDDALESALSQDLPDAPQGGSCLVLRTATAATYPTTGPVYYHCEMVTLKGSEAEGAAGTHAGSGRFVKAYNYGAKVPPVGSYVLGCSVAYGFVFHYA